MQSVAVKNVIPHIVTSGETDYSVLLRKDALRAARCNI